MGREPEEVSAPRVEDLCEGDAGRIAARKLRRFSKHGLLRCAVCSAPLVACFGRRRRWHFASDRRACGASRCDHEPETEAHCAFTSGTERGHACSTTQCIQVIRISQKGQNPNFASAAFAGAEAIGTTAPTGLTPACLRLKRRLQGPGRRLEASTGYRVRQAAEMARRRQLVEAGEFRYRVSIEDARKGNTTHFDLTPGAGLLD